MAGDAIPAAASGPGDQPDRTSTSNPVTTALTSLLSAVEPARPAFDLNPASTADATSAADDGTAIHAGSSTDHHTNADSSTAKQDAADGGKDHKRSVVRAWLLAGATRWAKGGGVANKRLDLAKARAGAHQVKEARQTTVNRASGPGAGPAGRSSAGSGTKPGGGKGSSGGGGKGPRSNGSAHKSPGKSGSGAGAGSGGHGGGRGSSGGGAGGPGHHGSGGGTSPKKNGKDKAAHSGSTGNSNGGMHKQRKSLGVLTATDGKDGNGLAPTHRSGKNLKQPAGPGKDGSSGKQGSTGKPGAAGSGGASGTSGGTSKSPDLTKQPKHGKTKDTGKTKTEETKSGKGGKDAKTVDLTKTPSSRKNGQPGPGKDSNRQTARQVIGADGRPFDTRESRETGHRDGVRAAKVAAHFGAYKDGLRDGWDDQQKANAKDKARLDQAHTTYVKAQDEEPKVTPTSTGRTATPIEVVSIDPVNITLGPGVLKSSVRRNEVRNFLGFITRLEAKADLLQQISDVTKGLQAEAEDQVTDINDLLAQARSPKIAAGEKVVHKLGKLAEAAQVQADQAADVHKRALRAADACQALLSNVNTRYRPIFQAVVDSPETRPAEMRFYRDRGYTTAA